MSHILKIICFYQLMRDIDDMIIEIANIIKEIGPGDSVVSQSITTLAKV
jgi:hypothetical protein